LQGGGKIPPLPTGKSAGSSKGEAACRNSSDEEKKECVRLLEGEEEKIDPYPRLGKEGQLKGP